jgi:alkaline phosphatase D
VGEVEANYGLWPEIAAEQKIVGPLVGHVTDTTAAIWAYAGPEAKNIELKLAPVGVGGEEISLAQSPDAAKHRRARFDVTGLKPRTEYTFTVSVDGDEPGSASGRFATAPAAGEKAKFRLAVASCYGGLYVREKGRTREIRGYKNKSWQWLMDERPDFQLLIGDNVYANSTDYNHLWDSFTLERANNEPFAEAVRTIPTYALWDDHDYGPNDSDGTARGKENSLRAFTEAWANPPRAGRDGEGIYTRFSWGDVDVFLLDGRYHRTPDEAPDDKVKSMLGKKQFRWLVEGLKASRATFKLLVNGSSWNASVKDGWRIYSKSRRDLFRTIVENNVGGVVLVSGDIHRCELPMHQPEFEHGYPLYEIVSSGLGSHGKYDPLAFVTVDFDTTAADPMMTARVIDGTGLETCVRRVRASELRVRD